jgi:D-methionine transport system permease protein
MWFDRLLQGFIDTFLMVGVSSLIALLAGIPLAVILVTSGKGGIYEAPALNRALGAFVNLFRSIPFLILMVALIPFTRLIVGTTYGVWAAVLCAHRRGQSARGRSRFDRSGAGHGLPALAHCLACVVA